MLRLVVDPHHPDPAVIHRAAHLLHEGKLGAIPTDTLYGLAVDPFNAVAVARVFEIKERDPAKALLIVASDAMQVWDWIGEMTPLGLRLAERFWPGPLTLVTRAPVAMPPGVADSRHTVGIRVPSHEVTRTLCEACGRPLTATSANVSGQPPTADPAAVVRQMGPRLDLIVDAGMTPGGAASTVVDVTRGTPTLIREGAIPWATIQACLQG